MRTGQHWDDATKSEVMSLLATPGVTASQIARELGLRRGTVEKYAKRLREAPPTEAPAFSMPPLPSSDEPLEDLIARRRAESQRVLAADEARKLVPIQIRTPGPIGLMVFGDPHVDDPGCDFVRLEAHLKIAAARPQYLFAGNIGDLHNNWIGRLQRLHANQSVTTKDAWRLVEWMMRDCGVSWTFLIRGNHDYWSGSDDPLKWIMRGSQGLDEAHGVRFALQHPGGAETRVHARHDFKGGSIYHDLHGLKRETFFGDRDHVIVAGHRHCGGDEGTVMPDGKIAQLVRVSGYKRVDSFAKQHGFKSKPVHPSALIVIDPAKPDDERDRVWCAPSVEEGVEYLDWKRAKYEGRARIVIRAA